jgi:hypothetical protein
MTNEKIKEVLSPRDKGILDAVTSTSWVPKEPVEILKPYMEKGSEEEKPLDTKLERAKKVYDGYGDILEKTKEIKAKIEDRCKNVVVTLNPAEHYDVIQVVKRVFGGDGTKVTFQMYQRVLEELSLKTNNNIPTPRGA